MFWYLTKPDIQDWVNQKVQEFAQEEIKGPRLTSREWLERYVYSGFHKISLVNSMLYYINGWKD